MSLLARLTALAAEFRKAPDHDRAVEIVEVIEEAAGPVELDRGPGWVEIGSRCSAGRRSLWAKLEWASPEAEERGLASTEAVQAVLFLGGREGDDFELRVDHSNPQFAELLDLVLVAMYAEET